MTDDLVRRARYALHDMQGRVEAGKLDIFGKCIDRIEALDAAVAKADELADKCLDLGGANNLLIAAARKAYRTAREATK